MSKLNLILIISLLGLCAGIFFLYKSFKDTQRKYHIAAGNERAYALENTNLKLNVRVFLFSIDLLSYLNDSLTTKINEVRKEVAIKDKNIRLMLYLLSNASKRDTVIFRDTLFVDTSLDMDTIIGDEWYLLKLGLKYPNIIEVNPNFVSEKYIFTSTKKETVEPPKKFFICRWFQKKHTVLEVNIVEKNPYIEEKQNRFIEIIK